MQSFLAAELNDFAKNGGQAVLALGTVAHQAVLMALKCRNADFPFSHGAIHSIPVGLRLYDSYHCSRYNTQTRRLTETMFEQIFDKICRDTAAVNPPHHLHRQNRHTGVASVARTHEEYAPMSAIPATINHRPATL